MKNMSIIWTEKAKNHEMNGILWKNGTEIMQHVLKNAVNFLDA
jgi:hypothetical protein